METIRGYLETMFQNLPNLPQVQKAKYELGQMMEDKYQELKENGKTENEAVAIVISEFGNLDELAEELGIQNAVCEETRNARRLSLEEASSMFMTRSGQVTRLRWECCFVSCLPVPALFLTAMTRKCWKISVC